ncbi:MAG: hypothetical protein KIT14_00780 [bacterium]|nr:hypothetical protein [bacterium]
MPQRTPSPVDPRAAPPDDAGTQGSFTRPEDTLAVGGESAEGPLLDRDQQASDAPRVPTAMVIACLVAIAIVALVVVFYAPT